MRGVKRLYLFTMDKAPFFARHGFERCTMDDFEPPRASARSTPFLRSTPRSRRAHRDAAEL
jgi:N-acetylglutamate synthase-like GNAT family acetyltransferase